MSTIEDYIYVQNHIPTEVCEELIDECNKKEWKKHTWNNYTTGTSSSEPTKELDVMPCTQEQQTKITKLNILGQEKKQKDFFFLNLVQYVLIDMLLAL